MFGPIKASSKNASETVRSESEPVSGSNQPGFTSNGIGFCGDGAQLTRAEEEEVVVDRPTRLRIGGPDVSMSTVRGDEAEGSAGSGERGGGVGAGFSGLIGGWLRERKAVGGGGGGLDGGGG